MQKIPSVFKRDYDGRRQVYDEVVPGCEWVLAGEGRATLKWDGTCCLIRGGRMFKRYDRKPTKSARKRGKPYASADDFKAAPDNWEAAEDAPNLHTGHWPGWLPIGDGPEDQWHREALAGRDNTLPDGTYELAGPKIQSNPHAFEAHVLVPHGMHWVHTRTLPAEGPITFSLVRDALERLRHEGIVWHHPDGRMAKIKRRDFGFDWPPKELGDERLTVDGGTVEDGIRIHRVVGPEKIEIAFGTDPTGGSDDR